MLALYLFILIFHNLLSEYLKELANLRTTLFLDGSYRSFIYSPTDLPVKWFEIELLMLLRISEFPLFIIIIYIAKLVLFVGSKNLMNLLIFKSHDHRLGKHGWSVDQSVKWFLCLNLCTDCGLNNQNMLTALWISIFLRVTLIYWIVSVSH